MDDAVLRSIAAGAAGFLLKSAGPEEIIGAVRAVVAGDSVLSPRSTRQVLDHLARDADEQQRREAIRAMSELSGREREVVRAVGMGKSNGEIAKELYLGEATVKTHLSAAQAKLGVRNRVEVTVLGKGAGLLR